MRRYVIAAIFTIYLTIPLFLAIPTRSTPAVGEYDPWADINDDGRIDMYDIGYIASRFYTFGAPVNKTELLLELLSKIESLNTSVTQLQTDFSLNQTKIIRFFEPNETIASGVDWVDAATFVWTPTNSTSNAILNTYYYAEYKGTRGQPTYPFIQWRIKVNGVEYWWHQKEVWNGDPYAWTPLQSIATNQDPGSGSLAEGVVPNQAAFVIKFQIRGYDGTAYFRNIQVIMEIVDG